MNLKSFFLIFLLVLVLNPEKGFSQLQINGLVDFEITQAGDNSRFITNSVPSKFSDFNLAVTQINAFLFAPITDEFFFESRIQLDTWGSGNLNAPRIALASLTWDNPDNSYIIKFGRFVSPFGFYPKRQLSTDRVFITAPLGYSYFTNISDTRGYWPQAGQNTDEEYQVGDVGLPTIYFGGYTTGIGTSWEITPDKVFLDAAITNGTPITIVERSTAPNLAATARLQINPSIFWNQGFSASFGNFMQKDDGVQQAVLDDNNFQKFTQLLLGTDTKISFTYFEFIAEAIYSNWNVPRNNSSSFEINNDGSLINYQVSNLSGNIDIKYEPPSFSGGFLAFRAEHLLFLDAENPQTGNSFSWDEDVSRLTGVVGYKISRNILAKASFSEQGDFDGSEYTFRFQISAFF